MKEWESAARQLVGVISWLVRVEMSSLVWFGCFSEAADEPEQAAEDEANNCEEVAAANIVEARL